MNPPHEQAYRAIGARLAAHLERYGDELPSGATLQGLVADLAAEHATLVLPLKELVGRSGFINLARRAGSGSGASLRDGVLQDLAATFSPQVVAAMAEVLNGFLELPGEAQAAPEAAPARPRARARTRPQAVAATPPVAPRDNTRAQPRRSSGGRLIGLAFTTAALVAAAVAAAVVAIRDPRVCAPLGVCPELKADSPSQQSLDAARQAERDLRRARSIDAYRQALEVLERQLLKLSGDPLNAEQAQQREQLELSARDARLILDQEEADLQQLDRAGRAIEQARSSSDAQKESQLQIAREALDAIPLRSFSASDAVRLREQLEALVNSKSASSGDPATDPNPTPAVPGANVTPESLPARPPASAPTAPPAPPGNGN